MNHEDPCFAGIATHQQFGADDAPERCAICRGSILHNCFRDDAELPMRDGVAHAECVMDAAYEEDAEFDAAAEAERAFLESPLGKMLEKASRPPTLEELFAGIA